ncbi:hypothetical protein [Actinosynnema sp.]|uniref:hypothetical protein n=1 Tax=Actinosynnema sp. TaxID=1872144 RepID=UPI003F85BF75
MVAWMPGTVVVLGCALVLAGCGSGSGDVAAPSSDGLACEGEELATWSLHLNQDGSADLAELGDREPAAAVVEAMPELVGARLEVGEESLTGDQASVDVVADFGAGPQVRVTATRSGSEPWVADSVEACSEVLPLSGG